MLFPCALLCFLLASIASAAGPAHLRRPHDVLLAHGTKPGPRPPAYNPEKLKTVKQLELKEGHVYSVRRRAAVSHDYDSIRGNSRNLTADRIVAGFILQPL